MAVVTTTPTLTGSVLTQEPTGGPKSKELNLANHPDRYSRIVELASGYSELTFKIPGGQVRLFRYPTDENAFALQFSAEPGGVFARFFKQEEYNYISFYVNAKGDHISEGCFGNPHDVKSILDGIAQGNMHIIHFVTMTGEEGELVRLPQLNTLPDKPRRDAA